MEQQTKHTPGPWESGTYIHETPAGHKAAKFYKLIYYYSGPIRMHLADVYGYDQAELEANAQLIAEAPTTAAERDSLKQWKEEATELFGKWNKVDEYIRNHSEVKLGAFITDEALRFIQERDKLKEEAEELRNLLVLRNEEVHEEHKQNGFLDEELSKLKEENERLSLQNKAWLKSHNQINQDLRDINKSLVEALKIGFNELSASRDSMEGDERLELDKTLDVMLSAISKAKALNP